MYVLPTPYDERGAGGLSCSPLATFSGTCLLVLDADDEFGTRAYTSQWEYEQAKAAQRDQASGAKRTDGKDGSDHGLVRALKPSEVTRRRARQPQLLKFFAPWCVHCQHLAPGYKKLALLLQGRVELGTIDCEQHEGFCHREQIHGYPTLRLILPTGEVEQYEGPLDTDSLHSWVDAIINDPVLELDPAAVERDVLNSTQLWLVNLGIQGCGPCHMLRPALRTTAAQWKGFVRVGRVECHVHRSLCERFGAQFFPVQFLFPPGTQRVEDAIVLDEGRRSPTPSHATLDVLGRVLRALEPTLRRGLGAGAEERDGAPDIETLLERHIEAGDDEDL